MDCVETKETIPLESTALSIARSMTDLRPAHYFLKIDSFSFLLEMLENKKAKSYDSKVFEANGYKWKLSLYPNGDEGRTAAGHISLYLGIEATGALPWGWEVNAHFKFFVFDQIRDRYLTIQSDSRRFNELKKRWGFPKLLPIAEFKDATNGYLVHDECVFGVEISNNSGKGEFLARPEKLSKAVYTWKVAAFSFLPNRRQTSPVFTLANHKWRISLYPRGSGESEGKSISAFLCLNNIDSATEVFAEFKLSIKNHYDHKTARHSKRKANCWFSASTSMDWGYANLLSLNDIKNVSKGFLVKDTLIVEVEITRISTVKRFS